MRAVLAGMRMIMIGALVWAGLSASLQTARAADAPHLEVVGTVRTASGGFAICRVSGGETFSLKVGSRFEGWTLSAVMANGARFERDPESATLEIASPAGAGFIPPPRPAATAVTPAASPARDGGASVVPKGKWVDGDGQVIDPPHH